MNQLASQRPGRISIPESIESPQSKLVYLYLTHVDRATIEELAESLEINHLCLLPLLNHLLELGLVHREGDVIESKG